MASRSPGERLPNETVMTRSAFLAATDELIAEGDRLAHAPDWDDFRAWLLESDRLLESVWGRMDRYHLAWLNVGRDRAPPGSTLDEAGTSRFVVEVARAKVAVLRTMRTAVERQGWRRLADDLAPRETT
ncbi:MAG TPA: hypothetical protein VGA91_04600 [Candidatus Limnocylindria bacterium]